MTTTIPAITSQLAFTPEQTARVTALLAGRGLDPYHFFATDVLHACRQVEREDGWSIVADDDDVLLRAVQAGLVGFQLGQLWEALERRKRWRWYAMTDVIEAFMDIENDDWGAGP